MSQKLLAPSLPPQGGVNDTFLSVASRWHPPLGGMRGAALCPGLIGVSLSGYCLADDNKTFSCVVIKDKNTFVGMMSALCAYIDVVCRNVPVMQAWRWHCAIHHHPSYEGLPYHQKKKYLTVKNVAFGHKKWYMVMGCWLWIIGFWIGD